MLGFFKNIFKRLKNTVNQEKYIQSYKELINTFRRVTPLEIQDIDNIHTILSGVVENTAFLDSRMKILKRLLGDKAAARARAAHMIARRAPNRDKDVTYTIGGKVVYGDVSSEEERMYFSRENVESLNRMPLREKKCDFGCQRSECRSCIERRLRLELSKRLEIENLQMANERVKKRRLGKEPITTLNEKLGVPVLFGRYVADDGFKLDELTAEERSQFLKWKEDQKRGVEAARKILSHGDFQTPNEEKVRWAREEPQQLARQELVNPFSACNEEAKKGPDTAHSAFANPFSYSLQNPFSQSKEGFDTLFHTESTVAAPVEIGKVVNPFSTLKGEAERPRESAREGNVFVSTFDKASEQIAPAKVELPSEKKTAVVGQKEIGNSENQNEIRSKEEGKGLRDNEDQKGPALFPFSSEKVLNPFTKDSVSPFNKDSVSPFTKDSVSPLTKDSVSPFTKETSNPFNKETSNPFTNYTSNIFRKETGNAPTTDIETKPQATQPKLGDTAPNQPQGVTGGLFNTQSKTEENQFLAWDKNPFSTPSTAQTSGSPFPQPRIINPFSKESVPQEGGLSNPFAAFNKPQAPQTIENPFATFNPIANPFASQTGLPDSKPADQTQASNLNVPGNPFAPPQTKLPPFTPPSLQFPPLANPFQPAPPGQSSNFSTQNIFQSARFDQQEPGLFSNTNEGENDSFGRRKRAFRKR